MNYGVFIAEGRKNKKMSLKELSSRTKISIKTLSRYEKGKTDPSFSNMVLIAKELNLSLDLLAGIDIKIKIIIKQTKRVIKAIKNIYL